MSEQFYIVPEELKNQLVAKAYQWRGYTEDESRIAAEFSAYTARHGMRTHNGVKALHLDDLFGSKNGGCVPSEKLKNWINHF